MKTINELREIIQIEYDKKTTDTNYNFISRFATAVFEATGAKDENTAFTKDQMIGFAKWIDTYYLEHDLSFEEQLNRFLNIEETE